MLERVERSDVFNAAALAGVLLALGFLLLTVFGWFTNAVDEGLWRAEGGESAEAAAAEVLSDIRLRPTNEVVVIVGNGSDGRQGLAGDGTRRLENLGYGTLTAINKEGDPIDDSFVYYVDGFRLDAIQVGAILNIEEIQVRPLLDNPGVPTDGADIIVVLGQSADL